MSVELTSLAVACLLLGLLLCWIVAGLDAIWGGFFDLVRKEL